MKEILKKALENSYTYTEYRTKIAELIEEKRSTGHTQSEDLLHYSQLNVTRMNRLEKTIQIIEEVENKLVTLNKKYIWLVLSEGWCGDAAQILPIIYKMEQLSENIELKIALRDDNDALMQHFLTNGGKAIPKLIVLDATTLEVLGDFGPRPEGARKLITDYKEKNGVIDETIKVELQRWYLQDKGISIQNEIMQLF